MQNSSIRETRRGLLLTLFVLGIVTALILVPSQFRSEAGVAKGDGLFARTVSHDSSLPNYDIRTEKSREVADFLNSARQSLGKDAAVVANARDNFVRGEDDLRTRVPSLKVEYNSDIRTPEVIGPDVSMGRNFLTAPSGGSRVESLRNFVKGNNDLIGVDDTQAASLKVLADRKSTRLNSSHLVISYAVFCL